MSLSNLGPGNIDMRLFEFIATNREPILGQWETFARAIGPVTEKMDIEALRDHASEMLTAIAADLDTQQSPAQQHEKSIGKASHDDAEPATAAEEHGADRANRGFSIDEMVSEYRALRASVIRLWIKAKGALVDADIDDLVRFHEAIDQSLAESVARYTDDLDTSREMFIAILGHDLRTPLGAIITSATFMLDIDDLEEPHRSLTSRIASSARRMDRMVGDLLDLTRSRLGGGIPIERDAMSMEEVVRDVVDEISALHPDRSIEVEVSGDLDGHWDHGRLSQVLTNLIGNALTHGAHDSPVTVRARGEDDKVAVAIHNCGDPIPPAVVPRIFDPMKRREGRDSDRGRASAHLGLGLYIAERIVTAHDGRIDVESSESEGTTFTVRLPRKA